MKKYLTMLILSCALAGFAVACSEQIVKPSSSMEIKVPQTNNYIDYVEFSAEDLSVFKSFYGAAFGWEFQDYGPDYASFSGAGLDGGVIGGKAPIIGTTTVILYSDDLEKSEKAVMDAGGEITERHEFPGGKRFHFRDPTGNELAVWKIVEAAQD